MQKPKQKPQQTFNDGFVKIYETENTAAPGKTPVKKPKTQALAELRYEERIVGYGRYVANLQVNMTVDRMIRCPRRDAVNTDHVAVIGDTQYTIRQVQYPPDVEPTVMDLSLGRLKTDDA